jgi:glutamine synthetase
VDERGRIDLDGLRVAAREGTIDAVSIAVPDIGGRLVGKTVPAAVLLDALPGGIEISCSVFVYDAEQNVHEGFPGIGLQNGWADLAAIPDLATLRRLALPDRTALAIADLAWHGGGPVAIAPRTVLRRQADRAAAAGFHAIAAVEFEFHLYRQSYDEARTQGYDGLRPLHESLQDYSLLRAHQDDVLGAIWRALETSGIPVESVKAEMGAGQYEITFAPAAVVEAADRAALAKLLTKQVAAAHGLSATFMARLHHTTMGSSGHVHVSIADADGTNLFDPDGLALSPLGLAFAGGVMRRAPEFMLLACPHVNSYRRLDPENFVTAAIDLGTETRTVPFRVCGHGRSRNLEYRIPGADVNPYLILAGVVAAGLDGIEADARPFAAGSPEALAVGDLPTRLAVAAERWATSPWARATFGDAVVDTLANTAAHEVAEVERAVTPSELRRGFEWA